MPPSIKCYCDNPDIAGTYENQVLYKMCADHPDHKDQYYTSGKIIAIGRIYAASPERGAGTAPAEGDAVHQAIAKKLAVGNLDTLLQAVKVEDKITNPDVLEKVIDAHKILVEEITATIKGWPAKRKENWEPLKHTSFASKYLHFHRPNAFPIMDSVAKTGLRCARQSSSFKDYEQFCQKLLAYVKNENLSDNWTPRSVDTVLIDRGRQHGRREAGQKCQACGVKKNT